MISMLMMLMWMSKVRMNLSFWCLILIAMWLMIWRITLVNSLRLGIQVHFWMVRSTQEWYLSSSMTNLQISSWKEFLKIMHLSRKHLMVHLQEISKWIVRQQSPQRDNFFRNINIWIWKEKMIMWINISREHGSILMLIMKEVWMHWIWLHSWNFS